MFFIELPDQESPFSLDGKGISASGDGEFQGLNSRTEALFEKLPSGRDRYRFFLEDWNSFLYLSATDVSFKWE